MTAALGAVFVVCWSSGFIGAKLGTAVAAVPTLVLWRFLPLVLVLGPAAWWWQRRAPGPPPGIRQVGREAAIGTLSQAGYLLSVYWAIDLGVNAGTTALIDGVQPLVAAALVGPLVGVAVSARQWVGLALGLAGVVVVTLADAARGEAAWWSYLVPFGGMLSLVAATFVAQRSRQRTPPLTALAIHCGVSTVVFALLAAATGTLSPPADGGFWIAVAWLVVLSTLGGYGLYWVLLTRVGVTRLNALMFLMAPVTAVWGALMFGEAFSLRTAIGLGLGVLAVAVVNLGGTNLGAAPPPGPRSPEPVRAGITRASPAPSGAPPAR